MPTTVRLAAFHDAGQLAELRWLSRDPHEREKEPLHSFESGFAQWLREALANDSWRIAVADSQAGALDGCMYLHFVEKVPTPGDAARRWGYVTNAYVREGQRGVGAGGSLLALLIEIARAEHLEFLIAWPSREAVVFYERAGFLAPEREREALPDDEPSYILHLQTGGGRKHEA